MKKAYLSQFDNVSKITRGMSGDEKYRVERNGEAFLLRVSSGDQYETKKKEYGYLEQLNRVGLPVPGCVSFGKDPDTDQVLTLLSWVEGEEAEQVLPRLSAGEQYGCGIGAGRILRDIHDHSAAENVSEDWYDRYFNVIEPRLRAFAEKGIPFSGSDRILGFIEENKPLLKTRPLCRHHGDYHTGNLIIHEEELWVIDWHTVDFDNIGDPWYEFNRIAAEHPAFARGQIDGYFDRRVPEEFWRLFALYFAASAITSIVWAKYRAPHQLEYIMEHNRRVLTMFEDMKNPVPLWYRE